VPPSKQQQQQRSGSSSSSSSSSSVAVEESLEDFFVRLDGVVPAAGGIFLAPQYFLQLSTRERQWHCNSTCCAAMEMVRINALVGRETDYSIVGLRVQEV
jgi:hypothetical protein